MRCSIRIAVFSVLLAAGASGCANEIGDSCSSNVECSPNGDRICDTAQRDGYCTIAGCGLRTCPEEAACIRFFPAAFLSHACDPQTEDAIDPALTPSNDCTPDEICLSSGYCAVFSLEHRFCMRTCEHDDDCRDGYECRQTGTSGAEVVKDPERSGSPPVVRFCAQRLQTR